MGRGGDPVVEAVGKIALLFPGQGSQIPGMGKAFYDYVPESKEIFETADHVMPDIVDKIFNGTAEDLKQTSVTQPAIFIASCAAFKAFQARFPGLKSAVSAAAGHSLGEYSALFAAEVFNFQTGLKLVEYRGQILERACLRSPGGMAAILGMERDQLGDLCRQAASGGEVCEMVNFNCPGQIVIAGAAKGVASLAEKMQAVPGAKAIPLAVSGPFHSSLLAQAAKEMDRKLAQAALKDAWTDVYCNCDARPERIASAIRKNLATQIDHAVLWEDSIRAMIGKGIETFVEIGPGKVLTGLLRKIDRKARGMNVENPESLNKTLEILKSLEVSQA